MNEGINVVVEFILNMFELYIIYRFMNGFFEKVVVRKRVLILLYFLKYLIWLCVESVANYPMINLATNFFGIFIISCCYHSVLSKKIMVTSIIIVCLIMSETVVGLVIGLSDFNVLEKSINLSNFYDFLVKLIYWMMTLVINRYNSIKKDIQIPTLFTVSIFIIITLSIIMEAIFFHQKEVNEMLIAPFLLCVVLLNITIIYIYDILSKSFQEKIQLKLMEKEVESYHNQLEIVQKNYEEMQMFRHDYKNRLIGMQQMVNRQELQELERYLEEILGKLNSEKMYCDTGNMAIDSLANYLLAKAEENGIRIQTEIKMPDKINIPGDDIVVLVGNLIDNAIEANLNSKIQEKRLFFQLRYDKKALIICIKNAYGGNVQEKEGRLLTSKKDKSLHGFGMKSVDAIIEKYDGMKKLRYDEKEFAVTVMLYF